VLELVVLELLKTLFSGICFTFFHNYFSVMFIILMDHILFIYISKSGHNKSSRNKAYCKRLVCRK